MATTSSNALVNFCVSTVGNLSLRTTESRNRIYRGSTANRHGTHFSTSNPLLEPLLELRSPEDSILECSPARQSPVQQSNHSGIKLYNKSISVSSKQKRQMGFQPESCSEEDSSCYNKQVEFRNP